jgi:hypothetical protein
MTDLTATSHETAENIRTVEGFLNALQEEDFEAVDAALADDLVYENVGLSRIRGGRRTAKTLSRMEGRVSFETKIHRIAGDGAGCSPNAPTRDYVDVYVMLRRAAARLDAGLGARRPGRQGCCRPHPPGIHRTLRAAIRR